MATLYVQPDCGSDFSISKNVRGCSLAGCVAWMQTGIFAKRRRTVDGKRRTVWAQIGDPTLTERKEMLLLLKAGNLFALRKLAADICVRYK